jgi:uncharacterized membrane protein
MVLDASTMENNSGGRARDLLSRLGNSDLLGIVGVFILLLIFFVRAPLSESYWLDETITAWIVDRDALLTLFRSGTFQGQSPFYFLLVWGWVQIFGHAELALRSLSILCTGGSLWVLYQVAKDLHIRYPVSSVLLPYMTIEEVIKLSFGARPYALALFFAVLSVWALIRWMRSDRLLLQVLYVLATLGTFYSHYMFGGILAVHAAVLIFWERPSESPDWMSIAITWGLVGLLSIPGLYHLVLWSMFAKDVQFLLMPSGKQYLSLLGPRQLPIYLLFSLLFARVFGPFHFGGLRWERIVPALAWWLLPGVLLAFLYLHYNINFLSDRYLVWRSGGIALGVGILISGISSERSRALILLCWVFLAATFEFQRQWNVEDWRGASRYLQQQSREVPIFLYSGLVEGEALDWEDSWEREMYVNVPLYAYPIPQSIYPIPASIGSERARSYREGVLLPSVAREQAIFFAGHSRMRYKDSTAAQTLRKFFVDQGFQITDEKRFGEVEVVRFERRS